MSINFEPGKVYDGVIWREFLCVNSGSICYSKHLDSLVLISNYTLAPTKDRWNGDTLLFTGYGKNGDQNIDLHLNKMLADTCHSKKKLYLFEVRKPGQYLFLGNPVLSGEPFKELQRGWDGLMRNAWVFPLKIINTVNDDL